MDDRVGNLKTAIFAFNQALVVFTMEQFPKDYAMAQNNLGFAYRMLAEVEGKAGNCKRGIYALKQALLVYTPAKFPRENERARHILDGLLLYCKSK